MNAFRRACAPALLLLSALAACTPAGSGAPTSMTVMLDWVPNTNHTGIFVALENGWYADEGLQVEVVQPAEGSTGLQVVAAGKADVAISYQEEMTYARAEGLPVVSLAAVIQHNTSGFASPAGRGITHPKEFEGRRYGAWGSPMENAMLEALMRCDGGDVDKVEFVNVGWADYFVVTERDVDFAWIFYGWTGVEADLRGAPLNIVMLRDWAACVPDYYTPVIATGETQTRDKADALRRFMRATARGYEYATANPAEAAEILIKHAPESAPELIRRSQAWLSPEYQADAPRWGEQSLEVWQRYADWMYGQGLIANAIEA
ncbi:MAG: ABC transporter substrate-binding protein, partial [Chloroflexi bacterium]|nr:ABC transporter substrate-binding protein [Chloroflexota bacterium]